MTSSFVVFAFAATSISAAVAADNIDFGPGIHEVGVVAPRSGQAVNVAAGAVVRGVVVVSNASDVVVRGQGVIVGKGDASIVVADSSKVRIDGVTLMRPLAVRAAKASVSDVKASNIVFRPPVRDADIIARKDAPCLVNVSVSGGGDVTCENLSFSDFRLVGGPSRCYSRVEAAVGSRPIRGASFRNMPEGMELFKVGDVETDVPAHVFGNGYRKFLMFGWEMGCNITPEQLEKKAVDFWASGIEGVGLRPSATASNGKMLSNVMHDQTWDKESFRPQVEGYRKAIALPGLRHSFMRAFLQSPTNRIAWTDSAAWERIGKSMAVAAWFARETGMKGCLIDHEDYHHQKQFVRHPGDPEYDELAQLVRRRARELFAGVFREYPDAAIMSYWLLSIDPDYFRSASALSIARNKGDLWPHFVNGILDAMPPNALLIDGNEEGYRYVAGRGEYDLSSVQQRDHVIELIAPENRVKFRSQVRVGFGLFVDAFEDAEVDKNGKKRTGMYYRGPVGGSRTGGFAKYAAEASYASSEYVWLWNARRQWVDWGKPMPKVIMSDMTRVQKLKGIDDVLRSIADPETYAFRRVAELKLDGEYVNLIPDWRSEPVGGDAAKGFVWAEDKAKMPKGVELYVNKKRDGQRFGVDHGAGGAIRAEGGWGAFVFSVKGVSFGETYAVGGLAKGRCRLRASWKRNGAADWTLPFAAVPFKDVGGEWGRALSSVKVPENCDELSLILSFDLAEGESVWLRDLSVAKVFTIPKDGSAK